MTLRRLASIATALAALAILAGPAWSARVVEVRVGSHPTFTRVVFELDAPAGYRIERRAVDGGQELVVKLSAASARRQVPSRSPMVAGVDLEQSGTDSVARVRLRGASPRVKELILGGPPRIVLDFMLPDGEVAQRPRSEPQASQGGPPLKVAREAAEAPVAPKPEAGPTAEAPRVVAKTDAPEAARAETPLAQVERALEGERIVQPKLATPDAPEQAEVASPAPAPAATPPAVEPPTPAAQPPSATEPRPVAKAPPTSMPERPKAEPTGPFGLHLKGSDPWFSLGLVGAGLVLFLVVVATLLRRHSKPTSLDALEVAREAGEPVESVDVFATIAGVGTGATTAPAATFPVAGRGLFDDEREKGEREMDVAAELAVERGPRRALAPSMDSDSDVGAMVQELERRMAQLESRLDEANEARERLERQVTAQSEELRVQRAAIARTQRALRGMTRVGDEQATEPALRDPAKPTAGRG